MLNKNKYETPLFKIMMFSQIDIICTSLEEGEVQWNPAWDDYKGWEGGTK